MNAISLRQFVPVEDRMSDPDTEIVIPVGLMDRRQSRSIRSAVALTLVATASTIGLLLMLLMLLPMATMHSVVTTATADGGYRYPGPEERLRGIADDLDGDDVFAETMYGRLRGKRRKGVPEAGGESFAVDWFLGVPYAKPPIGNLRFKATESPDRWQTTRDALRLSAVCPQKRWPHFLILDQLRKDEDCLYLNIYAPVPVTWEGRNSSSPSPVRRGSQPLYPVMVYIHGGSYHVGSGNTFIGSHVLAQHGVVVVTINYRLGILGFLSGNDQLIGNYGIYDQIEALRWIRRCIGAFGGDAERVTIFGNSAGGASVGILAVSPKAKGLFRYVIAQSGSPLSFWAFHRQMADAERFTDRLAKTVSCQRTSISELVDCLRNTTWKALIDADDTIAKLAACGTDQRPRPDGVVLPDSPRSLLGAGLFTGEALMTGIVDEEMTRHIGMLFLPELYGDDTGPLDLEFDDGMDRGSFVKIVEFVLVSQFGFDESIAEMVVDNYTNWSRDVNDPLENRRQYVNFLTDFAMWYPAVELATYVAQTSRPTFLYTMQLRADDSGTSHWTLNNHQLELQYVFGSPFTGVDVDDSRLRDSYTEEDRQISRIMMTVWTNFAKTGNPTRGNASEEPFVDWTEFNSTSGASLRLVSTNATIRNHYRSEFVTLWRRLYDWVETSNYSRPWKPDSKAATITLNFCSFTHLLLLFVIFVLV